ncbi:MAG: cysteine-rich CWC family protein [Bacteroidales bacterium]
MSPSKINNKEKRCPRCGNAFICTGDKQCWCNNYHIPASLQRSLSVLWKDCLCENCLRELVSRQV